MGRKIGLFAVLVSIHAVLAGFGLASAESLVIAASPSLAAPLEALGRAFEATHPDIRVQIYFDNGLDLRRTVVAMENSMIGQYFIGKGPIHLLAPGGDELITRLEQKYYILPGTRQAYAQERLVVVVPEALVEAPSSLEELVRDTTKRVAIADPTGTVLGQQTMSALQSLGTGEVLKGRLDIASDARGVLDHLLSGQADAGIMFGHDAIKEQERVRVVAAVEGRYAPTVHSMAMERYCPNRKLCEEFLAFTQSPDAQKVLKQVGYEVPSGR